MIWEWKKNPEKQSGKTTWEKNYKNLKAKIPQDSLRTILKSLPMIAYMDSGDKNSLLSTADWLLKRIDA